MALPMGATERPSGREASFGATGAAVVWGGRLEGCKTHHKPPPASSSAATMGNHFRNRLLAEGCSSSSNKRSRGGNGNCNGGVSAGWDASPLGGATGEGA